MGTVRLMSDPRLYMRAAQVISARIEAGEYEPGQRLNIGLIADELGVQRDTVSHAMQVLAGRGLVEFFRGLGWYVTGDSEEAPG